mmetsp:Transcript_6611/g.16918  ORF Transcript_6611/g.16918 Transcript_6611/m.16918 type:complete len:80 (+) Transcript_6611:639-878(+)
MSGESISKEFLKIFPRNFSTLVCVFKSQISWASFSIAIILFLKNLSLDKDFVKNSKIFLSEMGIKLFIKIIIGIKNSFF